MLFYYSALIGLRSKRDKISDEEEKEINDSYISRRLKPKVKENKTYESEESFDNWVLFILTFYLCFQNISFKTKLKKNQKNQI